MTDEFIPFGHTPGDQNDEFESMLRRRWQASFDQTPVFLEPDDLPLDFSITTSRAIYTRLRNFATKSPGGGGVLTVTYLSPGLAYLPVTLPDEKNGATTGLVRMRLPLQANADGNVLWLMQLLLLLTVADGVGVYNGTSWRIPGKNETAMIDAFRRITRSFNDFCIDHGLTVRNLLDDAPQLFEAWDIQRGT